MENQKTQSQAVLGVALTTGCLLLVPLIAMQFTKDVDWGVTDFVVAGCLLFITGIVFMLVMRHATNIAYRAAGVVAIGSTFFMIWANVAVGLIGSGPNAANLMYIGVLITGLIGVRISDFTAKGLQRTMFAMAIAVVVLACIALATNMQDYPGSSVKEILLVNTFFICLFGVSGLLFRFAAIQKEKNA